MEDSHRRWLLPCRHGLEPPTPVWFSRNQPRILLRQGDTLRLYGLSPARPPDPGQRELIELWTGTRAGLNLSATKYQTMRRLHPLSPAR